MDILSMNIEAENIGQLAALGIVETMTQVCSLKQFTLSYAERKVNIGLEVEMSGEDKDSMVQRIVEVLKADKFGVIQHEGNVNVAVS